MSLVVVIGAGPMGLAAAYQALKDGHRVDVFEAGPVAGGMSAHFDFDGLSLERSTISYAVEMKPPSS